MSPAFSMRRRADDFDRLVEAARQGTPASGPVPAELAELAAFAAGLADVSQVTPRPDFSADLRERLMAAAATELTPVTDVEDRLTVRGNPATRRRHERRLTAGIASLAIIGASAGTALASQGALPGETLYPVKRAIENVRAGFTPSDNGKGTALLSDAGTRLDEVGDLARSSSDNSAEINSTLNAFSEQAKKASDLLLSNYEQHDDAASIAKLQRFTADSIDQLTVLEPLVPDSSKQALTEAAQTVLTIDSAAHNACPSCGGSPITSLPESLLTPVSNSLDALTRSLQPNSSVKANDPKPIKLPSVPATLGPANVDPSSQPSTQPSTNADSPDDGAGTVTKVLPHTPTSTPTSLGDAVKGVTNGVNGTVDGLLGTVNGLVGGILGTGQTPAP